MTAEQRLLLAETFLAQGRYAAAARLVLPLTEHAPRVARDLAAQRVLAHAAYGLGQLVVAEKAARRVLVRRRKDEAMMRLLVRILHREGRHKDAATWMATLDGLGADTWDEPTRPAPKRPGKAA